MLNKKGSGMYLCSNICKRLLKLFDKSFLEFASIKTNPCIVIIIILLHYAI